MNNKTIKKEERTSNDTKVGREFIVKHLKKAIYLPETYLFLVYLLVFISHFSLENIKDPGDIYGLISPFFFFIGGYYILGSKSSDVEVERKVVLIFRVVFFLSYGILVYTQIADFPKLIDDFMISSIIFLFSFYIVPFLYGAILSHKFKTSYK